MICVRFTFFALGAWILSSLLGLKALAPISLLLWASLLWLTIRRLARRMPLRCFSRADGMGLAITGIYAILVHAWLRDVWVAPSNDDTINHLYYLRTLIEQKTCLLGQTFKPGQSLFGSERNHFYPTGSHALIALWSYPWLALGVSIPDALGGTIRLALLIWPWVLWRGSRLLLSPGTSPMLRGFLVVSAATLPVFPLWPLGEGGMSRILAMILFTPLWFTAISRSHKDLSDGLLWSGFLAPILLFIHPSLLPLIGIAVLFFPKRDIQRALLGLPLGALFFILILRSGHQEVFSIQSVLEFQGWFDRLKGPFHYWFSDPYGFGKFLSPKNYPVYAILWLWVAGKAPLRSAILFATPFLISALSFAPLESLRQIGLIFYHSSKRVAELTPLIGLTLSCFSLGSIQRFGWKTNAVLILLSSFFLFSFFQKSVPGLENYHELYRTIKTTQLTRIQQTLHSIPQTAVILNDHHDFDALRFVMNQDFYNKWSECSSLEKHTEYCTRRKNLPIDILNGKAPGPFPAGREVWWIPEKGATPARNLQELSMTSDQKIYRIQ